MPTVTVTSFRYDVYTRQPTACLTTVFPCSHHFLLYVNKCHNLVIPYHSSTSGKQVMVREKTNYNTNHCQTVVSIVAARYMKENAKPCVCHVTGPLIYSVHYVNSRNYRSFTCLLCIWLCCLLRRTVVQHHRGRWQWSVKEFRQGWQSEEFQTSWWQCQHWASGMTLVLPAENHNWSVIMRSSSHIVTSSTLITVHSNTGQLSLTLPVLVPQWPLQLWVAPTHLACTSAPVTTPTLGSSHSPYLY